MSYRQTESVSSQSAILGIRKSMDKSGVLAHVAKLSRPSILALTWNKHNKRREEHILCRMHQFKCILFLVVVVASVVYLFFCYFYTQFQSIDLEEIAFKIWAFWWMRYWRIYSWILIGIWMWILTQMQLYARCVGKRETNDLQGLVCI